MMETEEWKTIEEFPQYEISNTSLIRHKTTGYIRKPSPSKRGYPVVSMNKNGKQYLRTVHTLLAKAFIPNPDNKPQINHIDGNKWNNNLDNLEWVTSYENIMHARNTGLHISDGDIPVSQYDLNENYIATYKSISEASRQTGANRNAIGFVAKGKTKYITAGGYIWKYA